ncbi:MAG: hypothetical protein ACFFCW_42400 [Candidatus Hodarchaeota archaeon]
MPLEKIAINGLFYTLIGASYLLIVMVTANSRIWGYQGYLDRIKENIPPRPEKNELLRGSLVYHDVFHARVSCDI